MTVVLCLSSKKQGGKSTLGNFIVGKVLASNGIIRGDYTMNEEGKLWVSDLFGNTDAQGIFDLTRQFSPEAQEFINSEIYPHIKIYSFADSLKEFLITMFGLSWESVYGTNEQKESATHLKWEDLAGVLTHLPHIGEFDIIDEDGWQHIYYATNNQKLNLIYHSPGPISGRELMKFFGTEVCRRLYGPCHAKATFAKIKRERPNIAVIVDGRFPDEVMEGKNHEDLEVYNIRLLRNPLEDNHRSETALDPDKVNWEELFDYIIDNRSLNIIQTCEAMNEILAEVFKLEENGGVALLGESKE